ncbi:MAG: efflux RND transporter periplasmic adaptor subunit [Phycisphaerales bacterium]|jgi:RND family efflux transporter MFP subunit|nr:efflux RND transporter periplasmic adaptor subunit [Phycisphaerales bacterium]
MTRSSLVGRRSIVRGRRGVARLGAVVVLALGAGGLMASTPEGTIAPARVAARGIDPSTSYPCVSRPSDLRQLAFPIRGRMGEVMVEPGAVVEAGTLIMRMEDAVQRQSVELARVRAEDTGELDAARTQVAFRETELGVTRESHAKGGASDSAMREAVFQLEMAEAQLRTREAGQREDELTLSREMARLEEMELRTPLDGVVLDVLKRPGESVDETKPVAIVVQIDPLWLDVNVPTREALSIEVGRGAEVAWQDLEGSPAMRGRVIFRSPVGDAGARQVQVRIEVANPEGLPSGMHGDVRFLPVGEDVGPRARAD